MALKSITLTAEAIQSILRYQKSSIRFPVKDKHLCFVPPILFQKTPTMSGGVWYITEANDCMYFVTPPYSAGDILAIKEIGKGWLGRIRKSSTSLQLRVTNVRIQRLHDMTPEDKVKEGMSVHDIFHCPWVWHETWDRSIKKSELHLYGWAANPWIWAVEFELI